MRLDMRRSPHALASAALLLLGTGAVAQTRDPVPTRISYERYGSPTGQPSNPIIDLEFDFAADAAAMTIVNGVPDNFAIFLVGRQPAFVRLQFDAILLVVPDTGVVVQRFDGMGRASLPIAVAERAFLGTVLHYQGLHRSLDAGPNLTFQLSSAIKVDFVAGNEQVDLQYQGPPLTATPIYDKTGRAAGDPRSMFLRTSIVAPSSGYAFRLDSSQRVEGTTIVYLTVEAPNPSEVVLPVETKVTTVIELGDVHSNKIDVRVRQLTRGMVGHGVYARAALIDADY
jgi:hypothetical protein